MRAYPTTALMNNPGVAPAVPELAWTYAQRRGFFGENNPSFKHGRGRARRHRRELDTRGGLVQREAILLERARWVGEDGIKRSWRELVYARLDGRAPYLLGLRARARTLMGLITAHGPASGWGVPQPVDGCEQNSKWTPYEVPKRSEKCWRWWRARRLELARLMKTLGWLWGKAVPSHRGAAKADPPVGQEEATLSCPPEDQSRYRDRSGEPWAAVAARIASRVGM